MATNKKPEHYTDKAARLAIAFFAASSADTAHTVPGKRLITRRKNALIKHTGSLEKAIIWLEQVDGDDS